MEQVENKLVMKVIDAIIMNASTEYFENMNCYVLDMDKGFLFYNDKLGFLYRGFSQIEKPSYLSSETQRSPTTISYTIGFKEHNLIVDRKRNSEDFDKLHKQILNCV
jgi:hypothetical protein